MRESFRMRGVRNAGSALPDLSDEKAVCFGMEIVDSMWMLSFMPDPVCKPET